MSELIGQIIAFVLMNFTATFTVFGLVIACIVILSKRPGCTVPSRRC